MIQDLSSQIEKAWQVRVNESPEAALRPLIELKNLLGIPSSVGDRESVATLLSREDLTP